MADKIKPTRGERLLVWRRRLGLNQIQAASLREVYVDTYRDWEGDLRKHDQPSQNVGSLQANEICLIKRRRAGKTQKQVAEDLRLSRNWVLQMEEGKVSCEALCRYWGE